MPITPYTLNREVNVDIVRGRYYSNYYWDGATTVSTSLNFFRGLRFAPHRDMVIESIFWRRTNTTAGDVIAAIYDGDFNLVAESAIDSDTTVGAHVSTIPEVTLIAGQSYYVGLYSQSGVGVARTGSPMAGFPEYQVPIIASSGTEASTGIQSDEGAIAAMPASLTAPQHTDLTYWTGVKHVS